MNRSQMSRNATRRTGGSGGGSGSGNVSQIVNSDGSITVSPLTGVGVVTVSVSGLYPGSQYRFGGARGAYVISTGNDNACLAQSASWAAAVWTAQSTRVAVFEVTSGVFNWYSNTGIVSGAPFVPYRVLSLDEFGVLRMGGGAGDFTGGVLPQGYQHQTAAGGMLAMGATPANATAAWPLGRILVWNGTDRVGGLNFIGPTSATGGYFTLEVKPDGVAIRTALSVSGVLAVANDSVVAIGNATTVSAWNGTGSVVEGVATSICFGNTAAYDLNLSSNAFFVTPAWSRKQAGLASNIYLALGEIGLRVAATGAAGAAITWLTPLTAKSTGALVLNATTYSAWGAAQASDGLIEGPGSSVMLGLGSANLNHNAYYNGSNWIRKAATAATNIEMLPGSISLRTTATSTAGSIIAWSKGLEIGLGASVTIGAYGATPVVKPAVTGSRGGNAALASFLTALSNIGWVTDSTSA